MKHRRSCHVEGSLLQASLLIEEHPERRHRGHQVDHAADVPLDFVERPPIPAGFTVSTVPSVWYSVAIVRSLLVRRPASASGGGGFLLIRILRQAGWGMNQYLELRATRNVDAIQHVVVAPTGAFGKLFAGA